MLPRDPELRADPIERAGNVASLLSIPAAILPAGEARDALMRWAAEGRDCYAYYSGSSLTGTPVAWVFGERVRLSEWPRIYAERKAKGVYRA